MIFFVILFKAWTRCCFKALHRDLRAKVLSKICLNCEIIILLSHLKHDMRATSKPFWRACASSTLTFPYQLLSSSSSPFTIITTMKSVEITIVELINMTVFSSWSSSVKRTLAQIDFKQRSTTHNFAVAYNVKAISDKLTLSNCKVLKSKTNPWN